MKTTQSFEWSRGTVTVHPATIRDAIAKQTIGWKLGEAGVDTAAHALEVYYFCQFVAQSEIVGDVGWKPPASTDSPTDLRSAFEAWGEMEEALFEQWITALRAVNGPKVPEEQRPEVDKDEKKTGA